MPEVLDAILPPVVSAREAAKLKLDSKTEWSPPPLGPPPLASGFEAGVLPQQGYVGTGRSFNAGSTGGTDHLRGYELPIPPQESGGVSTAGLDTVMSPFDSSNSASYSVDPASTAALPYPFAGSAPADSRVNPATTGSASIPFALHTLADAAVPDSSSPSHSSPRRGDQRPTGNAGLVDESRPHGSSAQIPEGPARSALLDLYFNQVVQPSLPMLVSNRLSLISTLRHVMAFVLIRVADAPQDKSAFLRWSAYLPSANSTSSSVASAPRIPSYLYFSVFALSSIYIPPSSPLRSALPPDAPRVYASAARLALLIAVMRDCATSGGDEPVGLEATQSAVLLALCDWAQGELDRAWTMSCPSFLLRSREAFGVDGLTRSGCCVAALAVTLAIAQSLHLPVLAGRDSIGPVQHSAPTALSPARLRTLHAVLIVHSLLSLRVERAPLSAALLDDYAGSIPPPPTDEAENWDLWRSDKTATELRSEWTGEAESPPSVAGTTSGAEGERRKAASADSRNTAAAALPSNSLLVFARLAELCNIGTVVLRSNLRGRIAKATSRTTTSVADLTRQLQKWEASLEAEVRLEAATAEGLAAVVTERPRWTVAMHLLAETLRLSLLKDL